MKAIIGYHGGTVLRLVLVLSESIILDEGLLEKAAQAHALFSVRLHLVVVFTVLAHLDVLLELFDLTILHLILKLHLAVLPLKLLNKE